VETPWEPASLPLPKQERLGRPLFDDRAVKPFELFFDLVFVFALTQVSHLLESHQSWVGFGEGALVIAALWLGWESYAWLGTSLDLEEGVVRIAMILVMGAMLIVALAVPEAIGDSAEVFAVGYAFVRVMQLVIYAIASRGGDGLRGAVVALAPSATIGPAILLVGAFSGVGSFAAWLLAAMVLEYGVMLVIDVSGFELAPSYFSERHALIFIVALGEALISVGIGASGLDLSWSVGAATLLGFAIIVAIWWTYFDVNALAGQRQLAALEGVPQIRAAQHAYSYLHLPMITGVIFFSLGVKETLAHPDEIVPTMVAVAIAGGPALYLMAQVGFRARLGRSLSVPRVVAIMAFIALIGIADDVTAFTLLSSTAGVAVLLVTYEAWAHRAARHAVRHQGEILWE
jgi:low temperature requirement protein LtrA